MEVILYPAGSQPHGFQADPVSTDVLVRGTQEAAGIRPPRAPKKGRITLLARLCGAFRLPVRKVEGELERRLGRRQPAALTSSPSEMADPRLAHSSNIGNGRSRHPRRRRWPSRSMATTSRSSRAGMALVLRRQQAIRGCYSTSPSTSSRLSTITNRSWLSTTYSI